jgi:polyvinyl alcohol dehydrogenase (cytochrome)
LLSFIMPARGRPPRAAVLATAALAVLAASAGTLAVSSATPSSASAPAGGHRSGDWASWQHDAAGSRFNGAETRITGHTVGNLRLAWAYTYPAIPFATTGSQPAVAGGTLFVGAPDATFVALDARTGATRWTFDLTGVSGPVDAAHQNPVRDGAAVSGGRVYFADSRGWVYALDARTGGLEWATRLDDHPQARATGSPLVSGGRVYIGMSSLETGAAADPAYPCCTFRGQVAALDARTGAVAWRYYTVPPPQPAGTWPSGAARFSPSGVAVWSSPTLDRRTGTLYVGTGQNYTGTDGDSDSVLALAADTGAVRWKRQMTHDDQWTLACNKPLPPEYCPGRSTGTALDFDFGASGNLFSAGGRELVGFGQKSGVYHAFDARTGELVWQQQLAVGGTNAGSGGLEWGSSYDGHRLYVASWLANPGRLFALDPATGAVLWQTPDPPDGCSWGGSAASPDLCELGLTPAVSSSPGLVYEGSADGKMRVFSAATGAVLWQYDTTADVDGVNGLPGRGTAVSGNGGAVVANGMLYVQSGYYPFYPSTRGHVLLAFKL